MATDNRKKDMPCFHIAVIIIAGIWVFFYPCHLNAANMDKKKLGAIEITVEGVRTEQGGVLILALYNGANNWLKLEKAISRKVMQVHSPMMAATFAGLPLHTPYAIQVFHDQNENGKFDMRWFPYPKPKEGAGVSNNNLRRGPPLYEKAVVDLNSSRSQIRILLKY